jgi:hypothetical protein
VQKRYYFPLIGKATTYPDLVGALLAGPEAAKLRATLIAAELAYRGTSYRGFEVCAIDDEGFEIARRPIVGSPDA